MALYCTALHCTALHCTALHCTAPHCTAPHYTALQCGFFLSIWPIWTDLVEEKFKQRVFFCGDSNKNIIETTYEYTFSKSKMVKNKKILVLKKCPSSHFALSFYSTLQQAFKSLFTIYAPKKSTCLYKFWSILFGMNRRLGPVTYRIWCRVCD